MKHYSVKSQMERDLEDPAYRKKFEEGYELFKLEVQILNALEKKGWSYSDLARVMRTKTSNVSRDLAGAKIYSATVSRLAKMADALDSKFLPLFVSKKKERALLPKIQKLLAA